MALERTKPGGHIIGIDLLPAQPPRGVSAVQGNFLSAAVRGVVKDFVRDSHHRRKTEARQKALDPDVAVGAATEGYGPVVTVGPGYLDRETTALRDAKPGDVAPADDERLVDVSFWTPFFSHGDARRTTHPSRVANGQLAIPLQHRTLLASFK